MPTSTPTRPGRRRATPKRPGDRRSKPVTAFVFAGGASLGAMQAGMLQALYEQDIQADMLIGTSAGGLNAAFVASRPQTVATARELAAIWTSLRRDDIFPIHPVTVVGGLANHRDHLVTDRALRTLVSRHLELRRLEDAPVPLHLVSFDLIGGEEVVLSEGDAAEAVLAAAAMPGVLPPVPWEDSLLVDGGVVNNTPISHAVNLGAERIYVLQTYPLEFRGLTVPPRGALDAAAHAFQLLVGARTQSDVISFADKAELIVLPAANPTHVQPTDFDQAARLISAAHQAAREVLRASAPLRAAA